MPPKRSSRLKPKNPEPVEVIVDINNLETKKKKVAAKKKSEEDSLEDIREVFRKEQEEFNRKQEEKLKKALANAKTAVEKQKSSVNKDIFEHEPVDKISVAGRDEIDLTDRGVVSEAKYDALASLVNSLQSKVTEVFIKQEDLVEKQAETEERLGLRLNAHVQAVNSKFDGPSKESFRYKSSKEAIDRINSVLEHLLQVQFLARQEVERWDDSRSANQLNKAIDLLKVQAEDIRVAEASPLGYKLVEAYKNKDVGFRFQNGSVAITSERIERFLCRLGELRVAWPLVTAQEVARVVGSVVSMILVLENEAFFNCHFLQEIVKYKEREDLSWKKRFNVRLTGFAEEAWREISFWQENIQNLNKRLFHVDLIQAQIVFGDAGGSGHGGFAVIGGQTVEFHEQYTQEECSKGRKPWPPGEIDIALCMINATQEGLSESSLVDLLRKIH